MTTTELVAGRELDALVAEHVMNLPGVELGHRQLYFQRTDVPPVTGVLGWTDIPHYSTDIAAAWQIVEYFATHGAYVQIEGPANGLVHDGWRCAITPNRDLSLEVEARDETVPIAICRAALAAVGQS